MSFRTIALPRGFVARISVEDFDALNQFRWSVRFNSNTKSWYAYRSVYENGKSVHIPMGRQILGLLPGDPQQADHVNHDTLDNRRQNLRVVTRSQNCMNRRRRSDNKSGYKGVSWSKRFGAWITQIWLDGSNRRIGTYESPVEAAQAYDRAAREHFGQYAFVNFPAVVAFPEAATAPEALAA